MIDWLGEARTEIDSHLDIDEEFSEGVHQKMKDMGFDARHPKGDKSGHTTYHWVHPEKDMEVRAVKRRTPRTHSGGQGIDDGPRPDHLKGASKFVTMTDLSIKVNGKTVNRGGPSLGYRMSSSLKRHLDSANPRSQTNETTDEGIKDSQDQQLHGALKSAGFYRQRDASPGRPWAEMEPRGRHIVTSGYYSSPDHHGIVTVIGGKWAWSAKGEKVPSHLEGKTASGRTVESLHKHLLSAHTDSAERKKLDYT